MAFFTAAKIDRNEFENLNVHLDQMIERRLLLLIAYAKRSKKRLGLALVATVW